MPSRHALLQDGRTALVLLLLWRRWWWCAAGAAGGGGSEMKNQKTPGLPAQRFAGGLVPWCAGALPGERTALGLRRVRVAVMRGQRASTGVVGLRAHQRAAGPGASRLHHWCIIRQGVPIRC